MNAKLKHGSTDGRMVYEPAPEHVRTFAHGAPSLELVRWYLDQPLPPYQARDERYTTPDTKRWVLEQAGVPRFDLDVAACRESHLARDWYGIDHPRGPRDGLALPWHGDNFGNVPFSQWGHWIAKAWWEFLTRPSFRSHAMIIPNDRTEQAPWQDLVEPVRDDCGPWLRSRYMRGRTKYSAPGMNGRAISNSSKKGGSPFFSSVLLMWSRRPRRSVLNLVAREQAARPRPVPLRPFSHAVLPREGSSYARRYT